MCVTTCIYVYIYMSISDLHARRIAAKMPQRIPSEFIGNLHEAYLFRVFVHLYSMHLAIMSISAYGIRIAMVSISGTW